MDIDVNLVLPLARQICKRSFSFVGARRDDLEFPEPLLYCRGISISNQ